MNILLSIDNSYVEQLMNLVFSIKMYNDEKLNIYIIYDDLNEENQNKIENFIKNNNIGTVKFLFYKNDKVDFPINIYHIKVNTYYRLYAPFILDESIDKILYLDCDIICNDSISELYNSDFWGKCIVGCMDNYVSTYKCGYINAGVLLIDLKKYRELVTEDQINKIIEENINNLEYQDQDVLNILFKDNIRIVNPKYNYQVNSRVGPNNLDSAALFHYIKREKPWKLKYSEPIKAIPYYKCLYKMGNCKKANFIAEEHYKNKFDKLFGDKINSISKNYSVDIIIPTYNQTNTIRLTLDSICKQVLDGINMTVLLIDDCSQEDYMPIVEDYKTKINLKYYRMEKNSGVSGARQRGIDEGKGDFFTIIDSDDQYFSKYTIQFLYYAMIINDADVVRSVFFEEEHGKVRERLYRNDNIACHGKLYRKKFIKDNNVRYMELRGNEDTAYNALLESLGAKYYDLDVLTYRWCYNKESFTRKNELYHEQDKYTFAKGFLWTAQQIELRKDIIENPEEKICILLAKIFLRKNSCWYPETEKQMMIFAAKIYLICRRIKNINVEKIIKKYIPDKDPFIKKCLETIQKYMFELDEYKNMTTQEKIELGQLFKENDKIENSDNLILGDNVVIKWGMTISGISKVYIGDNTIIDKNVTIITDKRPFSKKLRNTIYTKRVNIGKNVFIGMNTIIMPGVTIGDNCYIEPGSVIFNDIQKDCIASGNPCQIVRNLGENDEKFYDVDKYIDSENI